MVMLEKTLKYSLEFFFKCFFLKREGKQLVREYQTKMAAESACAAVYIGRFQSFCILLHTAVSPRFIESAGLLTSSLLRTPTPTNSETRSNFGHYQKL